MTNSYPIPQSSPPPAYGYTQQPYPIPQSYPIPQQYPPPPPPVQYGPSKSQGGQTFEQAFDSSPKFQDIWATILFLLQFLAFIALSVISIRSYDKTKSLQGNGISSTNTPTLNTHTIILFSLVLAVAFILSFIYLIMARAIPRQLITATYIISIIIQFGIAIYYFISGYITSGIIFLIFALLYSFTWFSWRRRIPFASEVLVTVINVASQYKAVYVAAIFGLILQTAYSAWFAVTLVAAYTKFDATTNNPGCSVSGGNCSQGSLIGVLIFLIFSFYWTSQVIQNLFFTTICGTYGSFYFCAGTPNGVPKNPTLGSFKRATTYSFGSICFGSLLVALIQLIRTVIAVGRSQAQQSGDTILAIFLCCLDCCVACIQRFLQWVNKYAYTEVALYGKSYVRAGKDTWQIIKDRGFDMIINDLLIGTLLTMGAFSIGALTALFGFLYEKILQPSYNSTGNYMPIIIIYSFFVGFQMARTLFVPIEAGEATTFVALAEDPGALARTKPELFERFRQTYPQVIQGV